MISEIVGLVLTPWRVGGPSLEDLNCSDPMVCRSQRVIERLCYGGAMTHTVRVSK